MDKPYVVIHTHTSIDGNLDIMDLPEFREASRQYQELALSPEKQQSRDYRPRRGTPT